MNNKLTYEKYKQAIEALGIKDITKKIKNFNYEANSLNEYSKDFFSKEMSNINNDKSFFIHYKNHLSITLICCTESNVIFYEMDSNSIKILDKKFSNIAIINSHSILTPYFSYNFSKNIFEYNLNNSRNSTRLLLKEDSGSFIFHRPDKILGATMIEEQENSYKVNFSGTPYGVINLDKSLDIIDINLNSKIRSKLGIKKEPIILKNIENFEVYYKELMDIFFLKSDKTLPFIEKEIIKAHIDFVKSVIKVKNEIIDTNSYFSKKIKLISNYKLKATFTKESIIDNIKKYDIEYVLVNDINQNQTISRNYRNIINLFFDIKDNKIDILYPESIKKIEDLINESKILVNKIHNEKTILKNKLTTYNL